MLSRIFTQILVLVFSLNFKFLGVVIDAYWADVEVRVGRYAAIALWGPTNAKGLYLISGDREYYWEWPWG